MSLSTMNTQPLLMTNLMDRGAMIQPDNLIITKTSTGYATITYRDSFRRANQLANSLVSFGFQKNERIATFMWNNARHMQCYHGIPKMGGVLHALNIRLGAKELGYIIEFSEDQAIVIDEDLLPQLCRVSATHLRNIRLVLVCGVDEEPGAPSRYPNEYASLAKLLQPKAQVHDWDNFLNHQPHHFAPLTNQDDSDALAMAFTSGTTGEPKGICYSHRGQYVHTLMMLGRDMTNLSATDVLLPMVPYFHANAWGLVYASLMLGVRVVHTGRFNDPETILKIVTDHRVTFSAAVPTIWQSLRMMMETNLDRYGKEFCLKTILCGGASPPNEMMAWYSATFGTEFVQAWGMTETSPLGTLARRIAKYEDINLTEEEKFNNVKVAGLPAYTVQMKIVDSNDFSKELPWDGVAQGELLCRGPHITTSYYKNPQPQKFYNGWLVTGDIASITPECQLVIRDRSKDIIKSGGEWISSIDLEKAVSALPQIQLAVVIGVPHPKWDERPILVAKLKPGARPLRLEQVRSFLHKSYAKFQLPDDLIIVEDIPLLGTGKIDKKLVRKRLKEENYRHPDLRTSKL